MGKAIFGWLIGGMLGAGILLTIYVHSIFSLLIVISGVISLFGFVYIINYTWED